MKSIPRLVADATLGAVDRHWYTIAHEGLITDISKKHSVEIPTVAGVAAVLSPRISVSRNVKVLIAWFDNYGTRLVSGTLDGHVQRLVDEFITRYGLTGTHSAALTHFLKTGIIRGPKTSQFAAALAGNYNACPLDVWMARALEVPQRDVANRGPRALAVNRITQAANILGWRVAETQAAIWATTYRSWYTSPILPSFSE